MEHPGDEQDLAYYRGRTRHLESENSELKKVINLVKEMLGESSDLLTMVNTE